MDSKQINFQVFKSVSLIDKYNFYEYMSVMLDGGVTISETLDSAQTKIKNEYFRQKIRQLQTFVSSGDAFSKSMKKIPQVFSGAEISIVEAGEATWKLAPSLWSLSENLRKTHELQQKVKSSLTYPLIIFLFLFVSVLVVLTYVIPAITPLFETSEVELPFATQALVATSDFIRGNFFALIFFFAVIGVGMMGYKNTEKWRANIDYILLGLPLIGTVYKNYILSSLSANLWNLIWSGVPVVKALTLTSSSLGNKVYESILGDVISLVSGGNKIVDSMAKVDERNEYFPADFLQMLSVWEKTASLEKVSKKINEQYTREVNYSLANLTKWIEPLAILLAWVFVLWFAFAIFWAILKVTQTVA